MARGREEDILEEANWRHRLFQTNAVLFGERMSSGFRSEMDSIKPNMGTREDRDSLTSFLTMKTRKETPGSTSMWTTTSCCFSTVFLTRSNACPRGPKPAREDQKPAREDQKNKKKGYLVATKKTAPSGATTLNKGYNQHSSLLLTRFKICTTHVSLDCLIWHLSSLLSTCRKMNFLVKGFRQMHL